MHKFLEMAETLFALPICQPNRGPSLLTLAWTLQALAIVAVALRIWLRSGLRNGVSWDDYFMVASLVNIYTSKSHSSQTADSS